MSDTETNVEWTVLYHTPGKFKGRGEFLRLMLEDAQVPYKNCGDNLYGPNGLMDAFRGAPEHILTFHNDPEDFPLFFPPAIQHVPKATKSGTPKKKVLINQVAACMMYLGDQLGYAPQSAEQAARANCILLNALDYISEGRKSFHPVKNAMSYKEQKEEGDKCSKEFCETRMLFYLYHFERVVSLHGPHQPVAGGNQLTYADFGLFHVLDATVAQFNTDVYDLAWDKASVPNLRQYYEWMRARPQLQAYFASDRCARTCGICLFVLCFLWIVWVFTISPHHCVFFDISVLLFLFAHLLHTAFAGDSMM